MSTSSGKGEYLLLVRGADWHKGLSPEQLQNVMSQFRDWLDRLTEQGKIKGAQPLEREGRVVSGRHGRIVADGPFAESKEAIGGYFLLQVKDLDEATAIAQAVLRSSTAPASRSGRWQSSVRSWKAWRKPANK